MIFKYFQVYRKFPGMISLLDLQYLRQTWQSSVILIYTWMNWH